MGHNTGCLFQTIDNLQFLQKLFCLFPFLLSTFPLSLVSPSMLMSPTKRFTYKWNGKHLDFKLPGKSELCRNQTIQKPKKSPSLFLLLLRMNISEKLIWLHRWPNMVRGKRAYKVLSPTTEKQNTSAWTRLRGENQEFFNCSNGLTFPARWMNQK